jgi:predicted lactoylglutathione lyase
MTIRLDMVGLMVEDMAKSVEFYRRLGIEFPEGSESKQNCSVKFGELTFFINTKELNARWDPVRTDATGGYRVLLEFYLKTREAVDAKYHEMIGYGYASHVEPYVTFFNMYFAMVQDPDGNTILLSGEVE